MISKSGSPSSPVKQGLFAPRAWMSIVGIYEIALVVTASLGERRVDPEALMLGLVIGALAFLIGAGTSSRPQWVLLVSVGLALICGVGVGLSVPL